MIGHRNGEVILMCDGCYNLVNKGRSMVKGDPPGTNFHNRRCRDKYKRTHPLPKRTPDEVDLRHAASAPGRVKVEEKPVAGVNMPIADKAEQFGGIVFPSDEAVRNGARF